MKTKLMIGLGVMTAALFLVVPNAAPKGGSHGATVSLTVGTCSFGGECVIGSGFPTGTLEVSGSSNCGQSFNNGANGPAFESSFTSCTGMWTITVSTVGRHPSTLDAITPTL